MKALVGAAAVSLVIGVVTAAPADAAPCTYTYNEYGYPQWSDACDTQMAPGRFGPLKMGVTTVGETRSLGYLAVNEACGGRLDGVKASSNWRRKQGKVAAWTGYSTSKGLRSTDSLRKAKRKYPGMVRTGFLENPYVAGQGWKIHSVRSKAGWLDFYVYTGKQDYGFFAVRAKTSKKPYKDWSLDGC